ncbi:hypothetical protein ACF3NG_11460 (plasmid) [Aerococcaceae bacterium WGS1372]
MHPEIREEEISQENYICSNEVETKYLQENQDWKKDKTSGRYVPAKTEQKCGFCFMATGFRRTPDIERFHLHGTLTNSCLEGSLNT